MQSADVRLCPCHLMCLCCEFLTYQALDSFDTHWHKENCGQILVLVCFSVKPTLESSGFVSESLLLYTGQVGLFVYLPPMLPTAVYKLSDKILWLLQRCLK